MRRVRAQDEHEVVQQVQEFYADFVPINHELFSLNVPSVTGRARVRVRVRARVRVRVRLTLTLTLTLTLSLTLTRRGAAAAQRRKRPAHARRRALRVARRGEHAW